MTKSQLISCQRIAVDTLKTEAGVPSIEVGLGFVNN